MCGWLPGSRIMANSGNGDSLRADRCRRCWHVLLDEVDKELEHLTPFVRYADGNVYVLRAGQRVMQALRHHGKLRLQVNEEKSAVALGSTAGLQLLGSGGEGREAPGQQEGPDEVQGASPADYKPEWRAEPATGGDTALRAGVEGILRLSGYTGGFPRPGPMDPPPAAYVAITHGNGEGQLPGVEGSRCEHLAWRAAVRRSWLPCTRPCQGRTSPHAVGTANPHAWWCRDRRSSPIPIDSRRVGISARRFRLGISAAGRPAVGGLGGVHPMYGARASRGPSGWHCSGRQGPTPAPMAPTLSASPVVDKGALYFG